MMESNGRRYTGIRKYRDKKFKYEKNKYRKYRYKSMRDISMGDMRYWFWCIQLYSKHHFSSAFEGNSYMAI
jgi:hypothetical protein